MVDSIWRRNPRRNYERDHLAPDSARLSLDRRIKRINKIRLYRPLTGEPDAYPGLAPAMMNRAIRWDIIAEQYDQMIRYATAIRTGTASTEAILRRFTKATRSTPPTRR